MPISDDVCTCQVHEKLGDFNNSQPCDVARGPSAKVNWRLGKGGQYLEGAPASTWREQHRLCGTMLIHPDLPILSLNRSSAALTSLSSSVEKCSPVIRRKLAWICLAWY